MPVSPAPRKDTVGAEAVFARELSVSAREPEQLELAVAVVVEMVEGCDHAAVTMVTSAGLETMSATSELVTGGDMLQYELGEGPCVDTVHSHTTVISSDIATDPRWPRWGPLVARKYGFGSMLALLLYTGERSYGVLSLYSGRPNAFSADDILMAHSLATHLAVAVAAARASQNQSIAMVSRLVIGQAEGILMERHGMSAAQAFELLRKISQNSNRKLVMVAEELVETGTTEGLPPREVDQPGSGAGSSGAGAAPSSHGDRVS
ncbi:MAG: GAF and ANTAR domain-containing protein [Propionibacteriaceae bacterium]|nr:GAF and ANTAR domain-containing protein [Propionibacteriaceae bacterium]